MKKQIWIIAGCVILLAGIGWWFFNTLGEGEGPRIVAEGDTGMIGRQKVLTYTFSDAGQGLRHTEVVLTQDNRPRVLNATDYAEKGVRNKSLSVTVDAAALKLHDGPATLRLTAVDHSLWKNKTAIDRPVTIDFVAPQISQLNAISHINPGGSCVVAFRLSEAASRAGVQVGDLFYPAYPVEIGGKPAYVAYFALPMETTQATARIRIVASDPAGNETVNGIPALILKRNYRSDKMIISDAFLSQKIPEFQAQVPALKDKSPLEAFIYVNTQLRKENLEALQAVCQKSEPRQLWQGPFLRMKNAAPMAMYGDKRTYLYGGKSIGESTHNGFDLASLGKAPIEAANSGIVRFTGPMGIYGNAVVIDHGQGLSTLYAHMSAIQVRAEQSVKTGEVIGTSGATGLAGGDHLHFGVAIQGQFVDPREWWDPHWIEDNVTKKLIAAP